MTTRVLLFFTLLMSCFALSVQAKTEAKGLVPEYQLEGAGMTTNNSQQVTVSILSNKKDVTDADLGKCAVHGVLFRDYEDTTNSGFGSTATHKAIMGSPTKETEFYDFFSNFFNNGDYSKYVQVVSDTRRVVKVGKQYKISAKVRVNSNALKEDLKKQGMLKDLGSGW